MDYKSFNQSIRLLAMRDKWKSSEAVHFTVPDVEDKGCLQNKMTNCFAKAYGKLKGSLGTSPCLFYDHWGVICHPSFLFLSHVGHFPFHRPNFHESKGTVSDIFSECSEALPDSVNLPVVPRQVLMPTLFLMCCCHSWVF